MNNLILSPGTLTLTQLRDCYDNKFTLTLDPTCIPNINKSADLIKKISSEDQAVYGINTGFGLLANKRIPKDRLKQLQYNLIVSHAAGVGALMQDETVRILMLLKINSLARGYSGVRLELINNLMALYNHQIYPCIPEKGSVGASGDLAPLAHLTCALLGIGEVRYQGKIISAVEGLAIAKIKPIELEAKEGLALINGTQASTAFALHALLLTQNIFSAALVAGSLTVDTAKASDTPFAASIQKVRGQAGQITVAAIYRDLLADSAIRDSHQDCDRVQDPYSIRCQPQVMGACFDHMRFVTEMLITEANAVSDNPLIFADTNEILSGGNFHAEPVAMNADVLALCLAEIGALAERRIALLCDPHFSHLPAFLVSDSGLNSGFMIAHVTAAALASENKSLAHPASVDSIPTSANQEDHVSMATFAARRLLDMAENTMNIVAIELLASCQGLDFHLPLRTSSKLQRAYGIVRSEVAFATKDRFIALEIAKVRKLILEGRFNCLVSL